MRMSFALVALLLSIPFASATIRPNETFDDYEKRVMVEASAQQFICGNNVCEGIEFENCRQDCVLPGAANTTTTAVSQPAQKPPAESAYIAGGLALFVAIAAYSLHKYQSALKHVTN
ncbi:MAG: hypothetical protein HY516_05420 [Candidatus Aenigmarchaeota archaeon]|nr:hypothetical protein [Candidatus Aenigmarchaeota archaeon]